MDVAEFADVLQGGIRSGHGVILVTPDGKPVLTCRGELLSVNQRGGENRRFTAKQCRKMLEHLLSETMGAKVTVVDAGASA
jgi:hypothetical protein